LRLAHAEHALEHPMPATKSSWPERQDKQDFVIEPLNPEIVIVLPSKIGAFGLIVNVTELIWPITLVDSRAALTIHDTFAAPLKVNPLIN